MMETTTKKEDTPSNKDWETMYNWVKTVDAFSELFAFIPAETQRRLPDKVR